MKETQRIHFIHLADHLGPAFGMKGGTESAAATGEVKEPLLTTVRTPDAGKPAAGVAAVEVLLYNILDDWPKEAVLPLETILIFPEESLEIVKKHSVKHRVFRMTPAVDPCHDEGVYS